MFLKSVFKNCSSSNPVFWPPDHQKQGCGSGFKYSRILIKIDKFLIYFFLQKKEILLVKKTLLEVLPDYKLYQFVFVLFRIIPVLKEWSVHLSAASLLLFIDVKLNCIKTLDGQ